jgi:UDP-glucose 4-epimerase
MKILLTGASGYVGSETLHELVKANHDVTTISRTTRCQRISSERHFAHDLLKPIPLKLDDFDLIIHAAGANDVTSQDPAAALSLTTLTTRHVAEFAVLQRRPRLLYVSTLQVYGRDEGAIDESTACQPLTAYALTHLFAEQWVEQYGRTHGLRWINARLANIAGIPSTGRMDRWSLVPGCFCQSAMREHTIVVRSTGSQQRDFLPVSEVARRLVKIADDFDTYADGAVNVCSGAALTIGDIARIAATRFRAFSGQTCELRFDSLPGASRATPTALSVGSRLFEHMAGTRISKTEATNLMNHCIDQTYNHLKEGT